MMNPAAIMKLMAHKERFTNNHPKFAMFISKVISGRMIDEGSVIEITVERPDGTKVTGNMRVQASDIEMLNDLKSLGEK